MVDESAQRGLARLLATTARAHHEATGGINEEWAQWYAEYLADRIDEFVGFSPSVEIIGEWLVAADDKQRAEDPEGRWPPAYARFILEELAGS
jgi:hypothetical protein